ncbi:hypothetical protein QPL79_09205 [Ignisphaera sp. 4213-co]|uniref:Uncharacterized protein n=1 Tax=Ignisphaera cupida TaxID=3050454 RepID=A0ABD4Z8J3_9CREN|nr:hypothetical protein [Ignisphaera sp. 4213-co]MDK6029540.1 hypothetical protein [Ignisphaera sp. 4213-co]
MEELIKALIAFGYSVIILAVLSIALSGGEIINSPLVILLIFSIIIGVLLIILAIMIAKGKVQEFFAKFLQRE